MNHNAPNTTTTERPRCRCRALPCFRRAALGAAIMLTAGCRVVDTLTGQNLRRTRFAGYKTVVRDTHRASLATRERVLRETVAKDSYWIKGAWGDTIWCLAALYLNEKTDTANERLLKNANVFLATVRERDEETFRPETSKELPWPWAYFALTDYVRILCLFRAESTYFPGRLLPETEAAMKEALWWLVKADSKVADASLNNLLVLLGTENHDLTRRPNYYLVASVLKDDPAFKARRYDDGHTAAEHFAAYNVFFQE